MIPWPSGSRRGPGSGPSGGAAARRDRHDPPVSVQPRARGLRGAHAEHPELGGHDPARLGGAGGEPLAQGDPDRDRAESQAGAGAGGTAVSEAAPFQRQGEGDGGGGAEAVLLFVLVSEGRLELRRVAPAARAAGGAPGATAGFGGVGSRLPGNPNGPPPSNRCSWTVASAEAREASFVLR